MDAAPYFLAVVLAILMFFAVVTGHVLVLGVTSGILGTARAMYILSHLLRT